MLAINILPYNEGNDRTLLLPIVSQLAGKKIKTSQFDSAYFGDVANWVAHHNGRPIGFISAQHLPGLDGVAEIRLFVTPTYQKEKVASRLLSHLETNLTNSHIQELYHFVDNLTGIPAQFLTKHQFTITHSEYQLERPLATLPQIPHQPSLTLKPPPKRAIEQQFISLYNQSFQAHPWYQPYAKEEVTHTLQRFPDLLFLYSTSSSEPIGFTWLQKLNQRAIIEPIGIIPEWQGKGYARFLLIKSLHVLKEKDIPLAQIGLWANNERALHLYQSIGFTISNQQYQLSKKLN